MKHRSRPAVVTPERLDVTIPSDAPRTARMRVGTEEGVLVVFDATSPLHPGEGCSGYLAYWLSARDKTKYLFGATLHDESDLTSPLLALERDLGVDLEALADTNDQVDEALSALAEAPNEEIVWEPATLRRAIEIMGFDAGDDPDLHEPDGGQTAIACERCLMVSPAPPSNCGSPVGLAQEGLAVAVVCCPDGGSPPGPRPGPGPGPDPCTGPCCGSSDPCCGSSNPCCGSSNPCCGSSNPCCGSSNPCCGSTNPCCGSTNPCCGSTDPCCGSTDPCCGSSDPCCGSTDPCCGSADPCCGSPDPCCGSSNPCCGSTNPCCGSSDPCCGNPDPCCGNPDPCCGNPDPCCGNPDPCCGNDDPCDPLCGDPCDPGCVDCDDGDGCTIDICVDGICEHVLSLECCPDEGGLLMSRSGDGNVPVLTRDPNGVVVASWGTECGYFIYGNWCGPNSTAQSKLKRTGSADR